MPATRKRAAGISYFDWSLVLLGVIIMLISSLMIYDPARGVLFPRWGVVTVDPSIMMGQWFHALFVHAIGWGFVIAGVCGIMAQRRSR